MILSSISLLARENPFEAVKYSKTTGKATYKKDTIGKFNSKTVKLPSSSRILKSVELHFQNLDGSVESKNVKINKKIDWHDELVLKKLKEVEEVIVVTKINEEAIPQKSKMVEKKRKYTNFRNIMSFAIEDNNLYIKTKDKKIRDFLVTDPHKIVLDFKKDISFYTKVYDFKTPKFSSITFGIHAGYYRVAIELDGQYLYDVKNTEDGYIIVLR